MINERITHIALLDSELMAMARRQELDIPRDIAAKLGRSAVDAAIAGRYVTEDGLLVDWRDAVQTAYANKRSISPYDALPVREHSGFEKTRIQVSNETTLGASRRLVEEGFRPLALNFANGIHPGGGFLSGPELKRKCFVGPARCHRPCSTILCIKCIHGMNS